MREAIRTVADGLALAFGIVWILLTVLFVGCLVRLSSEAQNLTESASLAGVIAGMVVWVCGGPLVVSYAVAIMRGWYIVALVAAVALLIGMWAVCCGPVVASDVHGSVLAVRFAVGVAFACVSVSGAIGWVLHGHPSLRRNRYRTSHSRWKPPLPA